MNDTLAGWLQVLALVAALALSYRPLGDHIARALTSPRHLRVERLVYRLAGVDGDSDQRWAGYARGVLAFSAVSVLFLYGFLRAAEPPAAVAGQAAGDARPVLRHGRLVRHQHRLAVVRR